jgi:hypothetical protein
MPAENGELHVERHDDGWRLVGAGFDGVELVNEFLSLVEASRRSCLELT